MKSFKKFIDESQIDMIYSKAKIAVELVQRYNSNLLYNISTIANLASGHYGLYNSVENKEALDEFEKKKIIIHSGGRITLKALEDPNYQREVIKRFYPLIDKRKIKISDTIHVNVRRILSISKNDLEAIIHIASVIVHEATHENEFRSKNFTSEAAPLSAERLFSVYVKRPEVSQWIISRISSLR